MSLQRGAKSQYTHNAREDSWLGSPPHPGRCYLKQSSTGYRMLAEGSGKEVVEEGSLEY